MKEQVFNNRDIIGSNKVGARLMNVKGDRAISNIGKP
jgi:hypothetical protein